MILANVILPSFFYMSVGIVALIPTVVFVILSEAYVISKLLKRGFKESLYLSLKANILSGIFGTAVFWFPPILPYKGAYPNDLQTYVETFFIYAVVAYLTYYIFSLLLEWLIGLSWRRKHKLDIKRIVLLTEVIEGITFVDGIKEIAA